MQKTLILIALGLLTLLLSGCAGHSIFYGDEKMCIVDSATKLSVKMSTMSNGADFKVMLEVTDKDGIKHKYFDYKDRWPEVCTVQPVEGSKQLAILVNDRLGAPLRIVYDLEANRFVVN